jgi:hypothetical protein
MQEPATTDFNATRALFRLPPSAEAVARVTPRLLLRATQAVRPKPDQCLQPPAAVPSEPVTSLSSAETASR